MDATKTAVFRQFSKWQKVLAQSLAAYVSDDDATLDRRSFLELVRERIEHDLATGEY